MAMAEAYVFMSTAAVCCMVPFLCAICSLARSLACVCVCVCVCVYVCVCVCVCIIYASEIVNAYMSLYLSSTAYFCAFHVYHASVC